ncbi:hypothetical protein KEM55_008542 [Ascosphaera atra]|nr:hypothetical protein KEM55_008542 [Ascosphaera atra]
MAESHLSNEEFLSSVKDLLSKQSAAARGSVFLTQKRITTPTESPSLPGPILVRVSNGRHKTEKSKASTIVTPENLTSFYVQYAEICKEGMVAMKKRDRTGKKKAKGKGKK